MLSMKAIHTVSLMLCIAARILPAQISVSLTPSHRSPVALGTVITWTASASGPNIGIPTYRFRARAAGEDFHTVVDYGPNASLDWTTIDREGSYEIEVTARSGDATQAMAASAVMVMTSLAGGNGPEITATANPLVFIYSAPPCPAGQSLSVQFTSPEGYVQSTPSKPCSGFSVNFYLAGMRPEAQYGVQGISAAEGAVAVGPSLTLATPSISLPPSPPASIVSTNAPAVDGVLLQSTFFSPAVATDLSGNVVWYYAGNISYLTRPVEGGSFLGLFEDGTLDPSHQFIREFDLAGITLAETNAARINEQLSAMGVHPIGGFHHEVRKLPNGNYLALADCERILTDVQGPGGVDVVGDTILVLDPDFQVLWAWDAFDHLDPHRPAILGETCTYPAGLSCGAFYLAPLANDWLHGNALQLTTDGDILYSIRHQDWVVKIDYKNGAGSGNILWKLGAEGDFRLAGGDFELRRHDAYPWFSHQHDPNFQADGVTLMLYDNGNTRIAGDPGGHSRGQALRIDEARREAWLLLNADLGVYSSAVGSAQLLPNGDYHFDSGVLNIPPGSANFGAQSVEVTPQGQIAYSIQFGQEEYRTFRMPDLYTAP
ncbi:MAG TPA: aryl-sulfate sulfotransferase [Bryobacteraceae bacterium]|jgi:hypothetical protein